MYQDLRKIEMSNTSLSPSLYLDSSIDFADGFLTDGRLGDTRDDTLGRSLFADSQAGADPRTGATRRRLPAISVAAFVALCLGCDLAIVGVLTVLFLDRFAFGERGNLAAVAFAVVFAGLMFSSIKLYKVELIADFARAARRLARCGLVLVLALAFAEVALLPRLLSHGVTAEGASVLGTAASVVALWYAAVWAAVLAGRYALQGLFRLCVQTGMISRKVVVVGKTAAAAEFIERVHGARLGVQVVAAFDGAAAAAPGGAVAGVPVRGGIAELLSYHKHHDIDTVVVAMPLHRKDEAGLLVRRLSLQPLRVRMLPGEAAMRLPQDWYAPIGELPAVQLLRITDLPIERSGLIVKSLFDKLAALAALALFGPLMLACAAIIKIVSPGPIFFKQPRIGLRNRTFQMYKFRSMHMHDGSDKRLTMRNDSRIFPFGQVMRKLSLDELPQLINVLIGDMSLVGPRPHMPEARAASVLYYDVVPDYAARHRVKPGITGWAQVNGWRGPTETFEQLENRVRHDLYYIENWSFLLDVKILLRTVVVGFFGKNAF